MGGCGRMRMAGRGSCGTVPLLLRVGWRAVGLGVWGRGVTPPRLQAGIGWRTGAALSKSRSSIALRKRGSDGALPSMFDRSTGFRSGGTARRVGNPALGGPAGFTTDPHTVPRTAS